MTRIVLDNSVVLSWCLADESGPVADRAMRFAVAHGAVVPRIWWYELCNALVVGERRGRVNTTDTRATLADIGELQIEVDYDHDESALLDISRTHRLSVYDAASLDVAGRRELPLASLDQRLRQAASAAGIMLVEE